jgi:hypothetical protein
MTVERRLLLQQVSDGYNRWVLGTNGFEPGSF